MNIANSKTVQLWLKKSCESEVSRNPYIQRFSKFCKHYQINPDSLIQKWREVRYDFKERERFIDTWTENIEHYIYNELEGYAPLTIQQEGYIIISFFNKNKIPIVNVDMPKHPFVKYHNRDIKKDEVKRILEHSGIREKSFYLMMVESGLRPATLLKLRYENIKEDFEENKIPMRITVPQAISKDKIGKRFSFIGEDGFNALKEYLSLPYKQPLEDNTFIFEREKDMKRTSRITTATMSNHFRSTVLKLGLVEQRNKGKPMRLRMYCLRKYFEGNIRVDKEYRNYWSGWKWGTGEHYISTDTEVHRKKYANAYPSIRIYQPETDSIVETLKSQLEATQKELSIYKTRYGNIVQCLNEAKDFNDFKKLFVLKEMLPDKPKSATKREDS